LPEYKTQDAFAGKLGITASALSQAETGKNGASALLITSICREFNVNESWLLTGEGDMFPPKSRYDEISAFLGNLLESQPNFRHRFISAIASMTVDEWALLEMKIREITEETAKNEKKPDPQ
jgi:transcriptional regulator with XRE-family HTH domain